MKKWEQRKKRPDKRMFGLDLSIKKNPKTQVSIELKKLTADIDKEIETLIK